MARVTKANAEMVAAAVGTIFTQPNADAVAAQFEGITGTLEGQFPDVVAMLARPSKRAARLAPGARSGRPTRRHEAPHDRVEIEGL